jgi:hypothetical protein
MKVPSDENIKSAIISLFICLTHSLSVWQLSELFFKRLQDEKHKEKEVEYWCSECEVGPFPNKRSLDGHFSKAHRVTKRRPNSETRQTATIEVSQLQDQSPADLSAL